MHHDKVGYIVSLKMRIRPARESVKKAGEKLTEINELR